MIMRVRWQYFDAYILMLDSRHKTEQRFEVWESRAWLNYYSWEYKYSLN